MSNKMYSFRSHKCFYEYINKILPKFEVKESISKGRFTFVYDGNIKPYRNFYQFLGELNSLIEKELFLIPNSRITSRTRYKVFVDEVVETTLLSGEDTLVEAVKEVLVGTGEAVMPSHYAPVIQEPKVEDPEAEFTVDWDWVESLEDNKEDKLLLDKYAEDNTGVKLKRNLKIKNMIRDFKKALA
mgnify:CR=1 FL=1